MLSENSIEARLCGGGAIATGIKFNPGFANASDQMAVQIHIRHIAAGDNLSVGQFEILTLENGIVHLTFDLPHESVEKGFGVVKGVGFVPPPHVANIRDLGAGYKGACAALWTGTR